MMRYAHIEGLDKPISRLAQGAIMLDPAQMDWSFALLDAVYELGCNTFDTAHIYGGGSSEQVLGQWIRERGLRDEVVILTKGAHPGPDRKRVTPDDIASDLNESLERLQTDYVDIYLLHRDDPDVEIGVIVEALNAHHAAGRINVFGGSNWTYERVAEANVYAKAHDLIPFGASSPNFSLAEMVAEPWDGCLTISGPEHEEDRRWYADQALPVFTWSSLARGFFAGNISRASCDAMRDADRGTLHAFLDERNFQRLDRVEELAREKEMTVPQIAMAYVTNMSLNIFPLIGCYSGEEFKACLEASTLKLTPEEMEWLDLRREER